MIKNKPHINIANMMNRFLSLFLYITFGKFALMLYNTNEQRLNRNDEDNSKTE